MRLGKIIDNVVSVFTAGNTRPLQQPEDESEWFQQQLEQYGQISGNFVTICVYEVSETRTVRGQSLMVYQLRPRDVLWSY